MPDGNAPTTSPGADSVFVMLARVSTKLDAISDKLDQLCATQDMLEDVLHQHDVELEKIRGEAHTVRQELQGEIKLLGDRQGRWGGFLVALQAAMVTAAEIVGNLLRK